MKITGITLKNFKRFTELEIAEIPEQTRLVLLIGSNGSGKSSVFDAFGYINNAVRRDMAANEEFFSYFKKDISQPMEVALALADGQKAVVKDQPFSKPALPENAFYGRTSFRQIPRLTRKSLGSGRNFNLEKDSDRPHFFIERDNRFENDIEKITEIILKDFFRSNQSNQQIRERYIDPINRALFNVFGQGNGTRLQLIEIIPPLEGKVAQINFKKGNSEVHYNYLSAGEKEVFNLLVNLLSRSSHFNDSIYFLDEIDLHLNTRLQFNLLKEITENWIPASSQLWTASHALGFIEYARQAEDAVIIDFDDFDFDYKRLLKPEPKDTPNIFEIAVGKELLPAIIGNRRLYFVENTDAKVYASLNLEIALFAPENNRNSVFHKVRSTTHYGIVDRDFLSDGDIAEINLAYPKLRILEYYSIENYLFHPENLEAHFAAQQTDFNKADYVTSIVEAKNEISEALIPTIALTRTEYPFFSEPRFNGSPNQNRFKNKAENKAESKAVADLLASNDFNTFYKVFPMKTYGKQLPHRQNLNKHELARTLWFKNKIIQLIN